MALYDGYYKGLLRIIVYFYMFIYIYRRLSGILPDLTGCSGWGVSCVSDGLRAAALCGEDTQYLPAWTIVNVANAIWPYHGCGRSRQQFYVEKWRDLAAGYCLSRINIKMCKQR